MKALLLSMLVAGTLPGVAVAREYACDMTALTRSERATYSQLVKKLRTLVQEQKELPSGYAFRFAPDELETVARWVNFERRCCPFFDFELALAPDRGPLWLRVTGDEGIKEFIRAEFGLE